MSSESNITYLQRDLGNYTSPWNISLYCFSLFESYDIFQKKPELKEKL